MGIDIKLVESTYQVPYDVIRYLSRDEIARFGIDRTAGYEAAWMISPDREPGMIKFVTWPKQSNGPAQSGMIKFTCSFDGQIVAGIYTAVPQGTERQILITAIVGDRKFYFPKGYVIRAELIDPNAWFEWRETSIPMNAFDPSAFNLRIELNDFRQQLNNSTLTVSGDGFPRAWKTVASACSTTSAQK